MKRFRRVFGGLLVLATMLFLCTRYGSILKRDPEPAKAEPEPVDLPVQLLSPTHCARLVVEIDYVKGCKPSDCAIDGLKEMLGKFCDKPAGIEVVVDEELTDIEPRAAISDANCAELRKQHESLRAGEKTAKLYVLFVPFLSDYKHRQKGSRGWCREDLIVIAREELRTYAFAFITLAKVERRVLVHEAGHALGLVSNDKHEYRAHCVDPTCVMYYDLDFRSVIANLLPAVLGSLPYDFCSDCRADMKKTREGR
ncbi:MAG: hypothetical protein RDV41_13545 [Planctomycetota bacterium]|nr:hypothetical protein [Planctomycetota bacterium]